MINTAALPAEAKSKLENLELAKMSAEDLLKGAAHRLNTLPPDADELRVRLTDERERQTRKHAALHQLLSKVNQFLAQLPRGTVLEICRDVATNSLQPGEKLLDAVERLRRDIASARQRLQGVRSAPLPASDMSDLVDQYVASLLHQARPDVRIVGDKLRVNYKGDTVNVEDTVALMCWLAPDAVARALERELPVEHSNALPVAARQERIAELEAVIAELERSEEALIMRAAGDGLEILRRPDASPLAVLSVVVASAQAQVA